MKIVFDTKNLTCKVGNKIFGYDMPVYKQDQIIDFLKQFIHNNTKLSNYEEDCVWMSYRYCIGRHTIASQMHAGDIWKNCKGRMHGDRALFTAFDINREIERQFSFIKPYFHFPLTSFNKIYTPAVDIVCEFIEDHHIKSIEDFIKYKDINIILADNERGYKFETITWEEWLRPQIFKFWKKYYSDEEFTEDDTWNDFLKWKKHDWDQFKLINDSFYKEITKDMPNPEHYYMHDFEDLFIWNDLVHCFDWEHHHKSVLIDGSEVEWFWSWIPKTEKHDDGNYYRTFGYEKVRVPVDSWNGVSTRWIPKENIINDLY